MANKSHKYKGGRKMSPGPVSSKPKTVHKGSKKDSKKPPRNPGKGHPDSSKSTDSRSARGSSLKRDTKGKYPGKFLSPTQQAGVDEDNMKVAKRKRKQLRKQERDSKSSLNEQRIIASPKLVHANSIDVVDYSSSRSSLLGATADSFDIDNLTASLQPHLLQSWKGSSNSLGSDSVRVRRVQSDFSLSAQTLDERQYCAPERKQFYRKFLNALKHSGISNVARPQLESTPMSGVHVARMRSENLAIDNPFGPTWEMIWLEVKAYLSDLSPELYKEWMFFKKSYIDQVLRRIIDFKMPEVDPEQSLNAAFFGVDREETEPLYSVSSTIVRGESSSHTYTAKHVGFAQPLATADTSFDEPDSCKEQATPIIGCDRILQQDSTDSRSSADSETVEFEPNEFLSQLQIRALSQVCSLLTELEEVESLYPNRRRMGDDHPNYRTLNCRRRAAALILWYKVTNNLAAKLSSVSKWLGVCVELRKVCQDPSPDCIAPGTGIRSHFPLERQGSVELSSILVSSSSPKSPRSPTKSRLHFSVGSHSSEEDVLHSITLNPQVSFVSNTQSSNSSATLQRLFSNYQSVLENHGPYREFVNRSLKKKGLTYLMQVSDVYRTLYATHIRASYRGGALGSPPPPQAKIFPTQKLENKFLLQVAVLAPLALLLVLEARCVHFVIAHFNYFVLWSSASLAPHIHVYMMTNL